MGLTWNFDTDEEQKLLTEWAAFLTHVSGTLVDLTLETRYHVRKGRFDFQYKIDVGNHGRYGVRSAMRCSAVLLPVFAANDWSCLKQLTFIGMPMVDLKSQNEQHALAFLEPRVRITNLPGGVVQFTDDATPLSLSPPNGLFQPLPH